MDTLCVFAIVLTLHLHHHHPNNSAPTVLSSTITALPSYVDDDNRSGKCLESSPLLLHHALCTKQYQCYQYFQQSRRFIHNHRRTSPLTSPLPSKFTTLLSRPWRPNSALSPSSPFRNHFRSLLRFGARISASSSASYWSTKSHFRLLLWAEVAG